MIEFTEVSKSFRHGAEAQLLRAYVRALFSSRKAERFYALRNISFRVDDGESLAVIGGNGAGKSTLLSLVAGLVEPTTGSVRVHGRIAALLELGSGFHPELTGEENLRMNAALLGLNRRRTAEVFDQVLDFADIGDFIKEPLRTYSTGMVMRLAFAVAINVDPEILIVDEVLGVGDQAFQAKCFDRIRQFRAAGKTLLFVSHAPPSHIRDICDRALWLDHGRLVMDDHADVVFDAYSDVSLASRSI